MLHHVAEMLLQRRMVDDNRFAKERTHLRAADGEHVAHLGDIRRGQVTGRGGKRIAQPRAVDKEVQSQFLAG